MQWADEVRIETPEQVDVDLEVAGLGSRFVAQALDWLVKWGTVAVIAFLGAIVLALARVNVERDLASVTVGVVLGVVFYAFLLGYDIYYEARHNGQTPGKKMAGIRVVREGGGPVDFRAAAIRNLLGMADFLPGFYLLGAFLVLLNKRGQRLGDMAAGTIVLRERVLAAPEAEADWVAKFASHAFTFTGPQLAACTGADRAVIRSYFERRNEMAREARIQLVLKLVDTFCRKTGFQPPTPIEDVGQAEEFLASLYRDVRDWARHGR